MYKLFFDGEYVQYNTTIYNKINLKHYTYCIDILDLPMLLTYPTTPIHPD